MAPRKKQKLQPGRTAILDNPLAVLDALREQTQLIETNHAELSNKVADLQLWQKQAMKQLNDQGNDIYAIQHPPEQAERTDIPMETTGDYQPSRPMIPEAEPATDLRCSMEIVASNNCRIHGHQIISLNKKILFNLQPEVHKVGKFESHEVTVTYCHKCGHTLEEIRGGK